MRHPRGTTVRRRHLLMLRWSAAVLCVRAARRVALIGKIGRYVARMHENGLIHGDLTTSNMILVGPKQDLVCPCVCVRACTAPPCPTQRLCARDAFPARLLCVCLGPD